MTNSGETPANTAGPLIAAPGAQSAGDRGHASQAIEGATAIAAARAVRLRESLLYLVATRGLTFAELARLSGLRTANPLYNFIHGHSAGLSHQTLEQICDAIPGLTLDELVGRVAPGADAGDAASTSHACGRPA